MKGKLELSIVIPAYAEEENLNIALINVLEMAKEYCTNNLVNSDKVIGDESINKVQEFLGQRENNFKSPEESNL